MSKQENIQNKRKRMKKRIVSQVGNNVGANILPIVVKIVLLGMLDAMSLYGAFALLMQHKWVVLGLLLVGTGVINWIYWRSHGLAAKYLAPGIVLLLIFQLFAISYSAYIAFTNYGTGHNGTKEVAITALMQSSLVKKEDSPKYPLSVAKCGANYSFIVQDSEEQLLVGNNTQPLHRIDGARNADGTIHSSQLQNCTVLNFSQILQDQSAIVSLSVPVSTNPNDGVLRTSDGQTASAYISTFRYDKSSDTMIDTKTHEQYRDNGTGAFVNDAGVALQPGWRVNVGFQNFIRLFTVKELQQPFLRVLLWTIEFSVLSVLTTFILGLFLAITLNDDRMKFRRLYRSILILPYAFPAFLSALVWAGMLNEKFGFINQVVFHGTEIPWLHAPTLAKIAVIVVNLWLGFPYMFLVCMGALQSIPHDLVEAATLDGASRWKIFRYITFPLLLVSVAPLLISSFAMNFNNFNLIYMLTAGGPVQTGSSMNIGSTDILISMVYKIAFVGANRDYGLASAFSIIIFLVVGLVSAISFKATKSLEELN